MQYFLAKQEALHECNYNIKPYILHDDYYQITNQYHANAKQYLLKLKLVFCGGFLLAICGCALLAGAIAMSCLLVTNFSLYGGSIACYFLSFLLIAVGIIFIVVKLLFDCQKAVANFVKLVEINAIKPDLIDYPYLMQRLLVTFGQLSPQAINFHSPSSLM